MFCFFCGFRIRDFHKIYEINFPWGNYKLYHFKGLGFGKEYHKVLIMEKKAGFLSVTL